VRPYRIAIFCLSAGLIGLALWRLDVGTVLALNTVVLRPRIDGQIQSVRYREGQMVASGDVLIELDPLPFRAQLHAAEAQRARDASLLENAKHDFERYDALLQMDSTTAQTRRDRR
jgi:multidrug efflux system membrane fusion protein